MGVYFPGETALESLRREAFVAVKKKNAVVMLVSSILLYGSELVETCDGHAPCAPCVVHMLNWGSWLMAFLFFFLRLFGSDIGRKDNH